MRCLLYFLSLCCLSLSQACHNPTSGTESDDSDAETTLDQPAFPLPQGKHRFCFVTNDDTAILEISLNEQGISGSYMNHYFGKDRNDGPLENARFSGDTLFADYKFWSEGVWSLREIAFLIQDGQAHEGFGPSDLSGEKRVFKDRQNLSFQGPLLSRATCGGNVDKIY